MVGTNKPSLTGEGDRLGSWKDIAVYLGRNERTLRRWEQREGLPVHRHAHETRSSVYAYRSELDAWRLSREPLDENRDEADSGQPAASKDASAQSENGIGRSSRRNIVAVAALLAVGFVVIVVKVSPRFFVVRHSSSSIAVLPFVNLSGDPAQEWFSDGLTETLISELSDIKTLKVISRTSAMRYKHASTSLKQIAQDLGVDAVVEGSTLRVGDRVRITAELIEIKSDTHLWGNTYESEVRDILDLQRRIAGDIATGVGLTVSALEQKRLRSPGHRGSPEATTAYLLALYEYNSGALNSALESAREAVHLDPQLAPAQEVLGMTLVDEADLGWMKRSDTLAEARVALDRALKLDPNRGKALSWLGMSYFFGEHDWTLAEANMRRVFQLDPSTGATYGYLLAAQGKYNEAVAASKRALVSDPANPVLMTDAARMLELARRYDEAIPLFRKAQELSPSDEYASLYLMVSLLLAGKQDEAFESWLSTADGQGPLGLGKIYRAVYRSGGWPAVWETYLHHLPPDSHWADYKFNNYKRFALLFLGRKAEAMDVLEQLEQNGDLWMALLEDPIFDPVRTEPRFKALLRRLGYPQLTWQ